VKKLRHKHISMPKTASYSLFILCFLFFLSAAPALCQSARQTNLFNDGWLFYKGDADASKESFDDQNWRSVNIPHDWSIEGPFEEQWASATAYLPGGIGWYRKTFSLSQNMKGKNLALYFDGVYKNSEVWINGQYLGKRPNGFIPFQYDITKYLHANGKNTVAVKVDHTEFADSRWYTGSGIYRNVYLVVTNPVSIDQWGVCFSTPQVTKEKALAKVTAAITNHGAVASSVVVKYALLDSKNQPVANAQERLHLEAGASAIASTAITVNHPMLWSTASGSLYKLVTTVYSAGKKLDDNTQMVGFRSIRFDKDHG
jgi:beta-galactosidase